MEKYVISLRLAAKLRKAGYPSNTLRAWYVETETLELVDWSREARPDLVYPAPMTDELLEQLHDCKLLHAETYDNTSVFHHEYRAWHIDSNDIFYSERSADALAQLWLWCKENGYIK